MDTSLLGPVVHKVTTWDRKSIMACDTYCLNYLAGARVTAPTHSLGCMCFESLEFARKFVACSFLFPIRPQGFCFLRVRGIGKATVRPAIASGYTASELLTFYGRNFKYARNFKGDIYKRLAPIGTVCYPEVLVLD